MDRQLDTWARSRGRAYLWCLYEKEGAGLCRGVYDSAEELADATHMSADSARKLAMRGESKTSFPLYIIRVEVALDDDEREVIQRFGRKALFDSL